MERYVEKIRIPDDDLENWEKVLRENNFTEEEVVRILSGLNENYSIEKATDEMVELVIAKRQEFGLEPFNPKELGPLRHICRERAIWEKKGWIPKELH